MVPRRTECTNLLVPVCLSASHIAYGSIRMEPVFMALGQAATTAAVLAVDNNVAVQEIDVPLLQNQLKNDPLADGTTPEILLDNDVTPAAITLTGNWRQEKGGGKYALSQLVDNSKGTQPRSVRFTPEVTKAGKYTVYIFNPYPGGGGGNPAQYDGKTTGKASRTNLKIKAGKTIESVELNTQTQVNEWIEAGTYLFPAGSDSYLEISNAGADGSVVADAVLLVPVQ
ncbi:FAD-dependent oxidoreductase [Salmonirosea aquatica]|uniref:FAD-dependent oxidoreductase n=1 Tax=Salmonirosea aquatica TaxID=2654236 RepID=UPI004032DB6B